MDTERNDTAFAARVREGVAYFEQMLKVMPDDRTALEFLTVAYGQTGAREKCERMLSELARVLIKTGDLESAEALLPRLEAADSHDARAAAVRIRALRAPRPELVPEEVVETPPPDSDWTLACRAEAALAERLGEAALAERIRALPEPEAPALVSTLALLAREKPEAAEKALRRLADETGDVPIPLDAFEPDRQMLGRLPEGLAQLRGVIPFSRLGTTELVVTLAPQDEDLKRRITEALGVTVRFFLAEPRHVEAALKALSSESQGRG